MKMKWLMLLMLLADIMLAQDKLFCPVCQKRSLKSEIRIGAGCTTAMATWAWYDSNGVYHYEDPNYTIWEYSCSRGHEFNSRGDITDSTDNRPWWVLPSPEEADSVRGNEMRVVIYNDTISLTLDTLTSPPRDSTDYTLPDIWWLNPDELDSTETGYLPSVAVWNALLRRIEALEMRLDWLEKNCLKLDTTSVPLDYRGALKYQPDSLDWVNDWWCSRCKRNHTASSKAALRDSCPYGIKP